MFSVAKNDEMLLEFPNKIVLSYSVDSGDWRIYAVFHLCLHCLPKYTFEALEGFLQIQGYWLKGIRDIFVNI